MPRKTQPPAQSCPPDKGLGSPPLRHSLPVMSSRKDKPGTLSQTSPPHRPSTCPRCTSHTETQTRCQCYRSTCPRRTAHRSSWRKRQHGGSTCLPRTPGMSLLTPHPARMSTCPHRISRMSSPRQHPPGLQNTCPHRSSGMFRRNWHQCVLSICQCRSPHTQICRWPQPQLKTCPFHSSGTSRPCLPLPVKSTFRPNGSSPKRFSSGSPS